MTGVTSEIGTWVVTPAGHYGKVVEVDEVEQTVFVKRFDLGMTVPYDADELRPQ